MIVKFEIIDDTVYPIEVFIKTIMLKIVFILRTIQGQYLGVIYRIIICSLDV